MSNARQHAFAWAGLVVLGFTVGLGVGLAIPRPGLMLSALGIEDATACEAKGGWPTFDRRNDAIICYHQKVKP